MVDPKKFFIKINTHSIRFKMTVMFSTLIALTILLVSTILYSRYEIEITKNASFNIMNSVNHTSEYLSAVFNSMEGLTIPFIGNSMIIKHLEDTDLKIMEFGDFLEYVNKVGKANPFVYGIDLYSLKKDELVTSTYGKILMSFPVDELNWYENSIQGDGAPVWNSTYEVSYYHDMEKARVNVISVSRLIRRNYFGEPLGLVNISINEEVIRKVLADIKSYASHEIAIIDENGIIVSHNNREKYGKITTLEEYLPQIYAENQGIVEKRVNGLDSVIFYCTIGPANWKLVSYINKKDILSAFNIMRIYTYAASVLAILTGSIFVAVITRSIHKPIAVLMTAMNKARDGKFDAIINEQRKDEFHNLYLCFNIMIKTIKELISELYEKKLLAKEAQLKALLVKINPHFIYNIMESMLCMMDLKKLDDLKIMVKALSRFYRLVLSEGKDVASIKEVVEQVESYVTIQKIRLRDKFDAEININNELYQYRMLNILLQPLIENAIVHGICGKSARGTIWITGDLKDEGLMIFTVEDNGVGIKSEKLSSIINSLESYENEDRENFALKNINQRIRLYYGDEYKLDIKSVYGVGTKVTMIIPITK